MQIAAYIGPIASCNVLCGIHVPYNTFTCSVLIMISRLHRKISVFSYMIVYNHGPDLHDLVVCL